MKSKRSGVKETGICCMKMNMLVLIVCSGFSFHYHQWNQKVEYQMRKCSLLVNACLAFFYTRKKFSTVPPKCTRSKRIE